jgi:hypothetical protein
MARSGRVSFFFLAETQGRDEENQRQQYKRKQDFLTSLGHSKHTFTSLTSFLILVSISLPLGIGEFWRKILPKFNHLFLFCQGE